MILTIDAGNTKTKWALFDTHGNIRHQDACFNAEIATAELLPNPFHCSQIVISNVAGAQHAEKLEKRLQPHQATITWIKASKQAANMTNQYSQPETLGTDRWAALIAAWHLQQSSCVVVNAGTATTIDAVIHHAVDGKTYGEFVGGMILPGIDLMQQSLGTGTAQLPKNITHAPAEVKGVISPFATTTANAIYSGAINATSGAIKQMMQTITQTYQHQPKVIISGGNAMAIKQSLHEEHLEKTLNQNSPDMATLQTEKTVTIVDNLVLHGLYLLATLATPPTTQS